MCGLGAGLGPESNVQNIGLKCADWVPADFFAQKVCGPAAAFGGDFRGSFDQQAIDS
jgi:hypothetical protein